MKKRVDKTIKLVCFITALAAMVIAAGCNNVLGPDEAGAKPTAGKGLVTISLGDAAGRTLLPAAADLVINAWELAFTGVPSGTAVTITDWNGTDPVELDKGTWSLALTAKNGGVEVATGASTADFNVAVGTPAAAAVNLVFSTPNAGQQGKLVYAITDSTGTITPDGITIVLRPLDGGSDVSVGTALSGTKDGIPAGYYLVIATLTAGAQEAVKSDAAHIYKDQVTRLAWTFVDADFHKTRPNEKQISSFKIVDPVAVDGTLNGAAKTISVTVPYGTDVTEMKAEAEVVGQIDPDPEDANDYSGPVTYTVTAEDETTVQYTVTVSIAAITGIQVKTPPTTTTYTIGETFDSTGLEITATDSIGTTGILLPTGSYTVNEPTDFTTVAGTKTITVTHTASGETVTFDVTVLLNVAAFTDLAADGSATATTTKLTLTFDKAITGLEKDDITLTAGTTGAIPGELTSTGTGVYELAVSGITASGTVTVAVSKPGYEITPSSLDVAVTRTGAMNITLDIVDGGGGLTLTGAAPFTVYKTGLADGSPTGATVSVSTPGYTYTWYVDGVNKGTGNSITINAKDYDFDKHQLVLAAKDTTTQAIWTADPIVFTVAANESIE
ncbi:hypothetical protein FACS1894124_2640 [Spirochaetia bacterium]|nr:hypothetical protein FACS1894124_2640 [Spirochaetia bacterium]